MSVNKVFLLGNLTRDPELRSTQGGTAVAEFGMAQNEKWTDANGEKREKVNFVDVTVWGKLADNVCKYLRKGSKVHLEGKLDFQSWDDKTTGEKRSKLKVTAEYVNFLDPLPNRDGGEYVPQPEAAPSRSTPPPGRPPFVPNSRQPTPPPRHNEPEDDDEDIPF